MDEKAVLPKRVDRAVLREGLFLLFAALLPVLIASCGGGGGGSSSSSPTIPGQVAGLKATAGTGQVVLTWDAVSDATSYDVSRGASKTSLAAVKTVSTTTYTDTAVTAGTTYYYDVAAVNSAGTGQASSIVSATPTGAGPAQVTGLAATPSVGQVALAWKAVTGATSYIVERATGTGSFSSIAKPTTTNYNDTQVTAGTTYRYEVEGVNSNGTGAPSTTVSATPWGSQSASITVDVLANRHEISPLIYGVNFPPNASYITDSGTPFVRWGGNNSTDYNWKNFAANLDNDWFFQNAPFGALGLNTSSTGADSQQFVKDVVAAGADPLMTMPILTSTDPASGVTAGWVASSSSANDYSFSQSKYSYKACVSNPYLPDDGDGIDYQSSCAGQTASSYTPSNPAYVTNSNFGTDYVPLLNSPADGSPPGAIYRSQWATALAPDFGAAPHFYDMDNESDIWNGTHRDIHPNPVTFQEQADDFVSVSGALKKADPKAITFGPVTCCWAGYWNSGAGSTDKAKHGNLDFWPWWLNDVDWRGQVEGTQLINVFDFHAYPEITIPSGASKSQIDSEILDATRDWWDTSYEDPNSWITNVTVTQMQPLPHVQARLVRALAVANSIMPGLPVSVTEWNFCLGCGADPIVAALTDADAWGLLGEYDYYAAARWTAPDPTSEAPSYQAMELFTNYDGAHHSFDPISVSATNDCASNTVNPYDCSTFASVNSSGSQMTLLVVNQSPWQELDANISLSNFTGGNETTYTVSEADPNQIVAGTQQAFTGSQSFPPYSITLLVISGTSTPPAEEWALNPGLVQPSISMPPYSPPGIIMMSQASSVVLHPAIVSGSGTGTVKLTKVTATGGVTAAISQANVNPTTEGAITLTVPPTGTAPGFYNFKVFGQDSSGTVETQSGIVEVGTPAATLKVSGDNQTGTAGTTLSAPLQVTATPGSSAYTASGLEILFTAPTGCTLSASSGTNVVEKSADGNRILVTTDSSGTAAVSLTLPITPGTVTVTAQGPYPVGHPTHTFTETAQ